MDSYMDSESTTPQFTAGQQTASFLSSCGILHQPWNEIHNVYTENIATFLLKRDEGVVYVTFSSHYMEVRDGRYEECYIQNAETVSYPSLKGDDGQLAVVHKGAFNRLRHILENTDLEAQLRGLQEQVTIFVGHSLGGAVATLAPLWFLEKRMKNTSHFCITFGSPLVGDARLGEAIARQDWSGRFCHVVSQHDIVPRMLLTPFDKIAEPLKSLLPHWRSIMGIDSVAGSDLPIQEASKTLIKNVLEYTDSAKSPYRPSGTYMFCSMTGAACIDDSEAVLKMLQYTMHSDQGLSSDRIAGPCISEHTGYGEFLEEIMEDITKFLQTAKQIAIPDSSFEMGIALELEAIGIGAQNDDALDALRDAGKMRNKQDTNIDKLNFELSESQSNMAMLEWYKSCSSNRGYYDCFKVKDRKLKRDIEANLYREKLATFWDKIVGMVEKHQLPSDFQSQNKWINAGTAYRKLVEPLDIAYYYQKDGNRGKYPSAGVRPHRHEVLEKWKKEKDQIRGSKEKKPRTKFASLTEDSCFWAGVEEALNTLQHHVLNEEQKTSLKEFEDSVWTMIEDRSISREIFLPESSFMIWWQKYKDLPDQSLHWQPNSPLVIFMNTKGWEAVGI